MEVFCEVCDHACQFLRNRFPEAKVIPGDIRDPHVRKDVLKACAVLGGIGIAIADPFTAKSNSGGNVVVRQLEPTIHYEFAFMFPADRPRTTLASMFIQAAEEGLRQQNQDHHY